MKDNLDIRQLFDKYVSNTCTPEEAVQLMRILQSGDSRDDIEQFIEAHMQTLPDALANDVALTDIFEKLTLHDCLKHKRHQSIRFLVMTSAAALLVVLLAGTYIYFQQPKPVSTLVKGDIAPGGNRATLTLADGEKIDLSTDQSGIVVGDDILYTDGSEVIDNGQLTMDSGSREGPIHHPISTTHYYQLSTPKGGTYQIVLPDGTKVWLNAASVLKYPSQFDEHERVVELEGEAYFEVATSFHGSGSPVHKRAGSQKIPFKVVSDDQTVEVLGTHFNINAYSDERTTNTTLLEGAVRIITPSRSTLLKPGQQSTVDTDGLSVNQVDTETIIDWKNGDFIFADETLENIMRKVTRWYNVNVVYQGQLPHDRYNAQISRNKKLSEVLHILELSGGLSYKITDGTLFLSPPN